MKKLTKISAVIISLALFSACSDGDTQPTISTEANTTSVSGENPETTPGLRIIGKNTIPPYTKSSYKGQAEQSIQSYQWKEDGKVVARDSILTKAFEPGDHELLLEAVSEDGDLMFGKKIIHVQTGSVILDLAETALSEIKSATFLSLNRDGKILDFKILWDEDFHKTDGGVSVYLDQEADEFYSQLNLEFKNGESLSFFRNKSGEFQKTPIDMIIEESVEEVDEMSGLHSLSFDVSTTVRIDPDQVSSFLAFTEYSEHLGVVESGYGHLDDETVYQWRDDGFSIRSFALGYGEEFSNRVSLCVKLKQAVQGLDFICSKNIWDSN